MLIFSNKNWSNAHSLMCLIVVTTFSITACQKEPMLTKDNSNNQVNSQLLGGSRAPSPGRTPAKQVPSSARGNNGSIRRPTQQGNSLDDHQASRNGNPNVQIFNPERYIREALRQRSGANGASIDVSGASHLPAVNWNDQASVENYLKAQVSSSNQSYYSSTRQD